MIDKAARRPGRQEVPSPQFANYHLRILKCHLDASEMGAQSPHFAPELSSHLSTLQEEAADRQRTEMLPVGGMQYQTRESMGQKLQVGYLPATMGFTKPEFLMEPIAYRGSPRPNEDLRRQLLPFPLPAEAQQLLDTTPVVLMEHHPSIFDQRGDATGRQQKNQTILNLNQQIEFFNTRLRQDPFQRQNPSAFQAKKSFSKKKGKRTLKIRQANRPADDLIIAAPDNAGPADDGVVEITVPTPQPAKLAKIDLGKIHIKNMSPLSNYKNNESQMEFAQSNGRQTPVLDSYGHYLNRTKSDGSQREQPKAPAPPKDHQPDLERLGKLVNQRMPREWKKLELSCQGKSLAQQHAYNQLNQNWKAANVSTMEDLFFAARQNDRECDTGGQTALQSQPVVARMKGVGTVNLSSKVRARPSQEGTRRADMTLGQRTDSSVVSKLSMNKVAKISPNQLARGSPWLSDKDGPDESPAPESLPQPFDQALPSPGGMDDINTFRCA